jgi:hypothetical protein
VTVVEQAVEDRRRDNGIAEDAAPLNHRAVARDQHRAPLVTARDELIEEVRGGGLKRQVAELIDDQQLGLGEEGEPLLQPDFRVRLGKRGDKGRGGGEQNRVALLDRSRGAQPPRST